MKKNIYFSRLIYIIFVTLILISIFIKTPNNKIILIPFLICSISLLGKNLFLILNKEKNSKLFHKIFIFSFFIFFFGFIFYWCYLSIINKTYSSLIFAIPFILIGIYFVKKKLFKNTNKNIKKTTFNPKVIISTLLVILVLLIGIVLLFLGIKNTYILNKKTKDYIITNSYFSSYDIYSSDEDDITYKLTYIYEVDDIQYSITTDYGTNYIPEENSIREVKYNPSNPEEALLVGTNNSNSLIYLGIFFVFGSFTFILGYLSVMGYFDKFKIDVIGTYLGIIFLIIGIGIILVQNGTTMSLIETIKSFGLWILIPIMFVIIGIYQIIKCLFLKK